MQMQHYKKKIEGGPRVLPPVSLSGTVLRSNKHHHSLALMSVPSAHLALAPPASHTLPCVQTVFVPNYILSLTWQVVYRVLL